MSIDLPSISYSPAISNPKLNPQKPYKLPAQALDSIQKVGEAANPNAVPAKMLLSLMKGCLSDTKVDAKLFQGRTYEDWVNMYNLAHNNAVVPLALDGLNKTPEIKVPEDVKTNMEINTEFTKRYHTAQERVLSEFSEMTAKNGVDTVQMKGIGFSMNYPDPQKRFGGDIDVFNYKHGTNPADSKNNMSLFVDKIAMKAGMEYEDHGYKHSQIMHRSMPIENHRNFLNVEVAPLHKKMNTYLFKVLNPQQQVLPHGTKVLVPSKEFNNVFISFHAMQHFVGSGLNFHHLADWAVQVKNHGMKVPQEAKGTKFEEFMYAFTNLANKHLGTNVKVPENKKLENAIFQKMLNPEGFGNTAKAPETKNPLKILAYKYKKIVANHKLRKEFWGPDIDPLSKVLAKSLWAHIKKPSSFITVFTRLK